MDICVCLAIPAAVSAVALLTIWLFETVLGTEEWG